MIRTVIGALGLVSKEIRNIAWESWSYSKSRGIAKSTLPRTSGILRKTLGM